MTKRITYITSSEVETINGTDYLHLYLDPRFSLKIKLNGQEVEESQIYIKAPTLDDAYDIRRVSTVIAKFEEEENDRMRRDLASLKEEELQRLKDLYNEELDKNKKNASDEEVKISCKEHIKHILKNSKSYQHEKDDFYTEFDRLVFFLQKRAFRMLDDSMLPVSLDAFGHLFAQKQFLLEAVFAEYVGFFSKHFPLESLSSLDK